MSRDQDKEGTLPTSDPSWTVVTPSKGERKGHPFLSLAETNKYHTIPPLSSTKKGMTMTKPAKIKKEESTLDKDKKIPPQPGEVALHQTLADLISDIDLSSKNQHEILKGLSRQGINTWDGFILMDEEDIPTLTKHVGGNIGGVDTPLTTSSIRMLNHIKQLVWQNMKNNVPGAKLASIYTQDMLQDYIHGINLRKKDTAGYNVTTSGLPTFTGPATSSKSAGEKKYEAWSRKTPDKTEFNILKDDKHYNIWKPIFEAQLAHQKMTRFIDPEYDATNLVCSYYD